MEASAGQRFGGGNLVLYVLLALIFLALLNIANEIRYQGCTSRQVDEFRLYVEGHKAVRPVQCHRMPFFR